MNGCPQCEALMINGVYCHETGCPQLRIDAGRTCPECGMLCADRSEAVACCAPLDCEPLDCEPLDCEPLDCEPLDGPELVRHE
jgi:hypothetical protein